ncbi:hypothetical protein [Hymenobacter jeollabukensis]|uniref:STAS/SEC14 domain-containing protein n=1 Tax=Hymenobacter jeollabukensis TaxID=2025313 RepID=A0A5R8WU99_9BACT|nr:hypothetical protein [Hymenobacter jeollabukensis]TLM95026.1 hypothetical protein FDY95_04285 [Hymenobacter jeollabukensis]
MSTTIPAPPPLLHTAYRADLDLLVSRWSYQPDPALLPPAYEELTAQAQACGCRFWLQDIRRRTLNDPAITRWLLTEYFPQMARRLGGRLAVAYLTGPALLEALLNGPGYLPPSAYEQQPFVVAFFGDEGEAIRWLQTEQRRP